MGNLNILITAASRRVSLVQYFKKALQANGATGRIVATDTDPNSPALYFTHSHHIVPLSTSSGFIHEIKKICKQEEIGLIIPTIDEELPIFGEHKAEFEKIGITVLTSDKEVGSICLDKYHTYNFFKDKALPFAKTYLPDQIIPDQMDYPLFIKPRRGRGSVNAYPVRNPEELAFFLHYVENPVVQNFLDGKEYTIDTLSDLDGNVLSVVPRERTVIRSGVCDRGKTFKNKELIDWGVRIADTLKITGPANLQCKVSNGRITFFEVNPRFSGAIQLTIESGADFPKMIVDMVRGIKVAPVIGAFKDNFTMISYETSLYRDNEGRWSE